MRDTAKLAVGPKHMLAKLLIVLAIASLLFVTFFKKTYHVVAPFQFVSTNRRIISAPFEGFIGSVVNVKPGAVVKAGDVLLEMDTSQLKLQKTNADSEALAKLREAQRYGADPTKTAERLQAMAEYDAARAQADLYQAQIDQAIVKAPIDGVVLSGDWMDRRHSPIRKGEELFKIAQGEGMRIELAVNERDIQWLKDDGTQKGRLATNSLPNSKLAFKVERIIPLPKSEQGANTFVVYGLPEERNPEWHEGMQGEARVEVGPKSLLWIWTHPLVDWLRLKLWI
jgi:multidrug efflux pump subunit AcrA (membrane-fusion protein)